MAKTALVSSCLLGLPTRYDGTDNFAQNVVDYLEKHQLIPIPICPEQLAGLPTPRLKCWFSKGDGSDVLNGCGQICDEDHRDQTAAFSRAAEETCRIAAITGSKIAILKQRSPSCGTRYVHQNGELIEGTGVTAAKLKNAGLRLLAEDDLTEK